MRRLTPLLAAAIALTLPAGAGARQVRAFAVSPRFSLDWVDTRAHFHDKLMALVDGRLRGAPGTPAVQRAAADVASHLLGPADRARPVQTARDLVTLPEDLGLMAALTGSRGQLARSASDLTTAIVGLIGTYAPVSAYYAARFPGLLGRPFPPTRLLSVALTDTFVRTAVETFAQIAQHLRAYVVAGVTLAQDWQVVCESKASYHAPPGAGPCAVQDPVRVALLRSPDEPARDYAYEATSDRPSTMALVFDPAGRLIAKTVKAYLTPTELPGQLDLVPGSVSGVRAIPTPVGTLGIVTSKDAWMPDITAKLDEEGTDVLVQPEFFVNDTIRTTGPWAADNIEGAGYSDILRHPSMRALLLPQLVGNVFDFSADSQPAVAVKPRGGAGEPRGALLGQATEPGLAAVGRWVVADDPAANEPMAQRRKRLGLAGEALLPGSRVACPDPLVAGPCRGGQVEDVVRADIDVAVHPRHHRPVARRRGPGAFAASRPLAPAGAAQRNVVLARQGRRVVAAYEQAGRVRAVASDDGGAHWSRSVALAPRGHSPQWWPSVAIGRGGGGYAVWQEGPRVHLARLAAGRGAPRVTGRAAAPMAGGRQWRPSVAMTAPGDAVLAWVDESPRAAGEDLPQAAIHAARVTGLAVSPPQRLDRVAGADPLAAALDNAWAPSVAARGGHVLASWVDFHDYDWNVEARESTDGGATFGAERQLNTTPAGVESLADTPRSAISSAGRPLVAWTDWFKDDASNTRPSRLYDTLLAGLGPAPVQVDGHGAAHVSTFAPALTALGDGALVAWQDQAAAPGRIFVARVAADGRPGHALRADDGGRSAGLRARPAVAQGAGGAVVAWEDDRDGPSQIYVTRAPTARLR